MYFGYCESDSEAGVSERKVIIFNNVPQLCVKKVSSFKVRVS